MDEQLFINSFEKVFIPLTAHRLPTLLIFDGHSSHLTYLIASRETEENISIVLLPPHTTNVLQPLDVGLFRSFKAKLSKVTGALKLLSVTGNYEHIGKTNFTAVFKQAYEESMSLAAIKNGFRRTGIYPYKPDAINKTCLMSTVTTASAPVSPTKYSWRSPHINNL